MKHWSVAFCAGLMLCASPAFAVPAAPGQGQIQGDVVQVNQQFHITGYNVRVLKIEWMPGDSAFIKGLKDPPQFEEGQGALVITAAVKNTARDAQELLVPVIQVQYKDATQTEEDNRWPFGETGKSIEGSYQPGQGLTIRYFIPNVPKPSAANPVTKIIFKPYNAGDNDAGFPRIFRMLTPPVSV